jgi:hypothetical protein
MTSHRCSPFHPFPSWKPLRIETSPFCPPCRFNRQNHDICFTRCFSRSLAHFSSYTSSYLANNFTTRHHSFAFILFSSLSLVFPGLTRFPPFKHDITAILTLPDWRDIFIPASLLLRTNCLSFPSLFHNCFPPPPFLPCYTLSQLKTK